MPPPYVSQPFLRAATPADSVAIRAFRPFNSPGAHYEREARRVPRHAAMLLEQNQLGEHQEALLFEVDGQLVAVAVLDRDAPTVGHIAVVGIERDLHGARILGTDAKLSRLVLATCLERLADDGCVTATAFVDIDHGRSKALLQRLDFGLVSRVDSHYELHAVTL